MSIIDKKVTYKFKENYFHGTVLDKIEQVDVKLTSKAQGFASATRYVVETEDGYVKTILPTMIQSMGWNASNGNGNELVDRSVGTFEQTDGKPPVGFTPAMSTKEDIPFK